MRAYLRLIIIMGAPVILAGCASSPAGNGPPEPSGDVPSAIDDPSWRRRGSNIAVPPVIIRPAWLKRRAAEQRRELAGSSVFHDFRFSDQIGESGIRFRNRVVADAAKTYKMVHYDHGNGVAVADVDGDGLHDIYFVTQAGGNELWKNLGGGKFENITTPNIALADKIGVAASFADIDNDGDADLYVTTVRQGNHLFENTGDGTFRDISKSSGLDYVGHSSAAVFFDYNNDGLLDLFLVNVGEYTTAVVRQETTEVDDISYRFFDGVDDAFSGHLYPERTDRSVLYKNLGDNKFVDVSRQTGLMDISWSGDASPIDLNEDGWQDLYILNMQGNDQYYENVEGTRFVNKSRDLFPRTPWGSMGIKVFDYDNDQDQDIYVTDMHSDMIKPLTPNHEKDKIKPDETSPESIYGNAFFRNRGDGTFEEVSDRIGAENYWPWGLSTGDLNADGFDDVFLSSSMNYPFRYGINSVLLNDGQQFIDSEFVLGVEPRRQGLTAIPWFTLDCSHQDQRNVRCQDVRQKLEIWGAVGSRSAVIFDLDQDGDLDVVTNDFNYYPMVLVSNLSERLPALRFLKVKLVGTRSNRDGLGARVTVHAGGNTYTKVHDGKSGYLSQSRLPLYFGLGDAQGIDGLEVRWPSGEIQILSAPIEVNATIEIREPLAATDDNRR